MRRSDSLPRRVHSAGGVILLFLSVVLVLVLVVAAIDLVLLPGVAVQGQTADFERGTGLATQWDRYQEYLREARQQGALLQTEESAILAERLAAGGWTPTAGPFAPGGHVAALAVHPADPSRVYALVGIAESGFASRLYVSSNRGESWAMLFNSLLRYHALAVTGNRVIVAGEGRHGHELILRSYDLGVTWTPLYTGKPDTWQQFTALAVDPARPQRIYAVGHEVLADQRLVAVVYITPDEGVTWTRALAVPEGCCGAGFNAISISPAAPGTVYVSGFESDGAGAYGVIYRSTDLGATWSRFYQLRTPWGMAWLTSFIAHPTNPNILYTGSGWGQAGVYRSQNAGATWERVMDQAGFALAFVPPNTLYALADWGDVFRSDQGGVPGSWQLQGKTSPSGVRAMAVDGTTNPITLYIGLTQGGVVKSSDSGASWAGKNNGIQSPIRPTSIVVDPANRQKLFTAGGYPGGYRSLDGGASWTPLQGVPWLNTFAIDPTNSQVVYAGGGSYTTSTIYKSMDGGTTWAPAYKPDWVVPDGTGGREDIYALAVDPVNPLVVYAAGKDYWAWSRQEGIVLRSVDAGRSWTRVAVIPSTWLGLNLLAIDPANHLTIFAAGELALPQGGLAGVLYRSPDGGTSWTQTLASPGAFRSLVADPRNPNLVYAADEEMNVWRSANNGVNWALIKGCCPGGQYLAIDKLSGSLYLGGLGYMGESVDAGTGWSGILGPVNVGMPPIQTTALTVDDNGATQTLYAGLSGVWKLARPFGQPFTPTNWTFVQRLMRNHP